MVGTAKTSLPRTLLVASSGVCPDAMLLARLVAALSPSGVAVVGLGVCRPLAAARSGSAGDGVGNTHARPLRPFVAHRRGSRADNSAAGGPTSSRNRRGVPVVSLTILLHTFLAAAPLGVYNSCLVRGRVVIYTAPDNAARLRATGA